LRQGYPWQKVNLGNGCLGTLKYDNLKTISVSLQIFCKTAKPRSTPGYFWFFTLFKIDNPLPENPNPVTNLLKYLAT
jgi:hypothetical protein